MSHTHWPANVMPNGTPAAMCPLPTLKACDEHWRRVSDDRYVTLAAKADLTWHKDRHTDAVMYTQVAQVLAGVREDITGKGGMPNMGPEAKRLRAAIERYRAANADGPAEVDLDHANQERPVGFAGEDRNGEGGGEAGSGAGRGRGSRRRGADAQGSTAAA